MSEEQNSQQEEAAQAPKRRGRPPKERPAGEGEPTAPQHPGEKPQPKRGRKPKAKAKATPEELETLAESLYGIHAVLAKALSMPELMLDAQASRTLAVGVSRMQEEFGFEVSGKTGAVLAFLGAAAMVYVPRVIAIKARVHAQQAQQAQAKVDGAIDADFAVSPGSNEAPGVQ